MVQAIQPDLTPAHRLHQCLLKAGPNGHNLARSLHLRAQRALGVHELIKRPFRELHDHIVHRRLHAGIRLPGHSVFDLVQRIANGDLGRHLGDGIAGGLGGQGGGTGHTGVYLDDRVFKAVRL